MHYCVRIWVAFSLWPNTNSALVHYGRMYKREFGIITKPTVHSSWNFSRSEYWTLHCKTQVGIIVQCEITLSQVSTSVLPLASFHIKGEQMRCTTILLPNPQLGPWKFMATSRGRKSQRFPESISFSNRQLLRGWALQTVDMPHFRSTEGLLALAQAAHLSEENA